MWTLPHYTTQAIWIFLLAAQEWMLNLKSMASSLPDLMKWAEVKLLPCFIRCHAMTAYEEVARQHILTTPLDARRGVSFTSRKVHPLQGVPGTHWKGPCVGLSQSEHYGILLLLPRNNPSFLRHPASKPSHYTDWASVNGKGFYCIMGADAAANMVQ